ncbi:MAG: hypothetical protein QXU65_00970 [Sulfolobales archaeon]
MGSHIVCSAPEFPKSMEHRATGDSGGLCDVGSEAMKRWMVGVGYKRK